MDVGASFVGLSCLVAAKAISNSSIKDAAIMIVAKRKTMLAGRDEEAYAEFVVRRSRMRWCLS